MITVTVYTTGPGCQRCKLTKDVLARKGIALTEVDIREQPAARGYVVDELGYTEAPVDVVNDHALERIPPRPDRPDRRLMTAFIDLWLKATAEADALRAQLAYLEQAWLRAEADADYWYFGANNPNGCQNGN